MITELLELVFLAAELSPNDKENAPNTKKILSRIPLLMFTLFGSLVILMINSEGFSSPKIAYRLMMAGGLSLSIIYLVIKYKVISFYNWWFFILCLFGMLLLVFSLIFSGINYFKILA
jgi:hypothetical protein